MQQAKDLKCCEAGCNKQAVAFWPIVDPDIPEHPYCRGCLDKVKMRLFLKLKAINEEKENT